MKILRTFVVIAVVLAVFFVMIAINSASAEMSESDLEKGFQIASEIKSGELIQEVNLQSNEGRFYKIDVKSGQQLKVFGSGISSTSTDLKISIRGGDSKLYSSDHERADGNKEVEAFYYKGNVVEGTSEQIRDPETVYIVVESAEGGDGAVISNYSFTAELTNRFDAGSRTDAYDEAEKAMGISKPQEFKNNYLGNNSCGKNEYCSTDLQDVFAIEAGKGMEIQVTIKPSTRLDLEAYFTDENGKIDEDSRVYSEKSGTGMMAQTLTNDEEISYLVVKTDGFGEYFWTYETHEAASIALEEDSEIVETVGDVMDEAADELTIMDYVRAFLWYIIIGSVILVALIILLVVFLMKKKKKKTIKGAVMEQQQPAAGSRQPTKPRASSEASMPPSNLPGVSDPMAAQSDRKPIPPKDGDNINK